MQRIEMVVEAGKDGILRLEIPVDSPNTKYHGVIHLELVEEGDIVKPECLSDEFINETAGKWIGDFTIEPKGDYEDREPRLPPR